MLAQKKIKIYSSIPSEKVQIVRLQGSLKPGPVKIRKNTCQTNFDFNKITNKEPNNIVKFVPISENKQIYGNQACIPKFSHNFHPAGTSKALLREAAHEARAAARDRAAARRASDGGGGLLPPAGVAHRRGHRPPVYVEV